MSVSLSVKGIISYPSVFKPKPYTNDPKSAPKYGCSILVEKTDPQIQKIQSAITTVQTAFFPNGMLAKSKNHMFIDCATAYPEDQSLHHCMIVRSKSEESKRPVVMDSSNNDVVDPSRVKPGDIGCIDITIFGFKTVNGGISAGLNALMIFEEEGAMGRLGSARKREEMFQDTEPHTRASSPIMTAKANGVPYETFLAQGWTHEAMVAGGYVQLAPEPSLPPTPPHQGPIMTAKANGVPYETFRAQGWTLEAMVSGGYVQG